MFAKVFGQIFDSSIAEDYNCRRMFMDLLVLADSEGVVDMTPEAIARRTNVPIEQVVKYVKELCEPDAKSRSKLHDGKRLIPLDAARDWGWIVVNYSHYRKVRDEEARREYFRSAMRKSRKRKKDAVKDKGLTGLTDVNNLQLPASASSSVSASVFLRFEEWMKFRMGLGRKPKDWAALFTKQIEWLAQFTETDQIAILDQSIRNGWQGLFEPKQNGQSKNGAGPPTKMSAFEITKRIEAIEERLGKTVFDKEKHKDEREKLYARRRELKALLCI